MVECFRPYPQLDGFTAKIPLLTALRRRLNSKNVFQSCAAPASSDHTTSPAKTELPSHSYGLQHGNRLCLSPCSGYHQRYTTPLTSRRFSHSRARTQNELVRFPNWRSPPTRTSQLWSASTDHLHWDAPSTEGSMRDSLRRIPIGSGKNPSTTARLPTRLGHLVTKASTEGITLALYLILTSALSESPILCSQYMIFALGIVSQNSQIYHSEHICTGITESLRWVTLRSQYTGILPIETRISREHKKQGRGDKSAESGKLVFLGFALAKGLIRGLGDRYPDPSPAN